MPTHPRRSLILLGIVLLTGLVLRILPAPISTGSDIAQFAGFADTFLRHGACFYKYASASRWRSEGWPYNWPYVYGPIWITILGGLRFASPEKLTMFWRERTYYIYVPRSWIVAVKSVLILGDAASAILLYLIIRKRLGGKWGLASMALYFLSPATIYVSSIYGMFDQIALALLLGGLLLLDENPLAAGVLSGYAFMAKQVVGPPILGLIMYLALRRGGILRSYALGLVVGLLTPLLPFMIACPSSIPGMFKSMAAAPNPGPVKPLSYDFNGFSSIATYLYNTRSIGSALSLIRYWWVAFLILLALALYGLYRRPGRNMYDYMLAVYIVFLASYWRVNYQYMVVFLGLAALALPYMKACSRLGSIQAYIAVNAWVFIYPLSWWFHVHVRHPNINAWRIVDKMTLMVFDDAFYVAYALGLTFILLSLLACRVAER